MSDEDAAMPAREEKVLDYPDDPDEYVDLGEEVPVETGGQKSPGIVISARLQPQVAGLLVTLSQREGKRVSQLVREAVIAYLAELESPKSKLVFHTDDSASVKLTGSPVPQISYGDQVIRVG